jgi:hypothetical protein
MPITRRKAKGKKGSGETVGSVPSFEAMTPDEPLPRLGSADPATLYVNCT